MKKEERYCKICGSKMRATLFPNEKPSYRVPAWTIYGYDRIGDAYDTKTGEKLYRVEMHCPNVETKGFWCSKTESHYRFYAADDITKEESEKRFDF